MSRLRIHLNGAEIATLELEPGRTYVAGRAPGCDIHLEEHQGISRQHFRLFIEDGQWVVQVMSKYGDFLINGETRSQAPLMPGTLFKIPPYDFFFLDDGPVEQPAEVAHADDEQSSRSSREAEVNALAPYTGQQLPVALEANSEFTGSDEATAIGRIEGMPYVRINYENADEEETLRLEGNLWIAGRDDSCEIVLRDSKASRRQFELASTVEGYYITDLGSANGTVLNGAPLVPNEATPLRSGDVISVSSVTIQFEVRDPSFKNKLVAVPQTVLNSPMVVQPAATDLALYAPPQGPGGVIPLGNNEMAQPYGWQDPYSVHPPPRRKKPDGLSTRTKFIGALAGLLVIIALFANNDKEPVDEATVAVTGDAKKIAFQKLSEPQKRMVRDSYNLAKNLALQKKWESAGDQLKKIHDVLPEGYEDSYERMKEVEDYEHARLMVIDLQKEQKRIAENQRRLQEIIVRCNEVANRTMSIPEIQQCVSEGQMIDPQNAQIDEFIRRVQQRIDQQQQRQLSAAEHADAVARRKALFQKAVRLEKGGDLLGAIAAYEVFLKSTLPDPENLKAKARTSLETIRGSIKTEVSRRIASARTLQEQNKGKDAFIELEVAKKLDPTNQQTGELMDKIVKDLNSQLQAIYSDSVLEEGLGNIDAAKEKWRKILEIDRPNGEYYRRAKSKLRNYGGQ